MVRCIQNFFYLFFTVGTKRIKQIYTWGTFYTEKPLHTEDFADRSFYTERSVFTETLVRTEWQQNPQSTSQYDFVLQDLHKVLPSTQYYFVLQSLQKVLLSTTLYYKACAKHFPVLLCNNKTCTKDFPVLLCTTKLAQSTYQYYFIQQSLHKALRSTTSYYKTRTEKFLHRKLLETAIFCYLHKEAFS